MKASINRTWPLANELRSLIKSASNALLWANVGGLLDPESAVFVARLEELDAAIKRANRRSRCFIRAYRRQMEKEAQKPRQNRPGVGERRWLGEDWLMAERVADGRVYYLVTKGPNNGFGSFFTEKQWLSLPVLKPGTFPAKKEKAK